LGQDNAKNDFVYEGGSPTTSLCEQASNGSRKLACSMLTIKPKVFGLDRANDGQSSPAQHTYQHFGRSMAGFVDLCEKV
jgi:hypothetical protein